MYHKIFDEALGAITKKNLSKSLKKKKKKSMQGQSAKKYLCEDEKTFVRITIGVINNLFLGRIANLLSNIYWSIPILLFSWCFVFSCFVHGCSTRHGELWATTIFVEVRPLKQKCCLESGLLADVNQKADKVLTVTNATVCLTLCWLSDWCPSCFNGRASTKIVITIIYIIRVVCKNLWNKV